jgi:hypothetical protein
VADALSWVQANTARVRELGEKREADAPLNEAERKRKLVLQVAEWKQDHADVWSLLEELTPSDFRSSVVKAIETAKVTDKQVAAIEQMIAKKKQARDAPPLGTDLDIEVSVTQYGFGFDGRGCKVFQMEFVAEGWRGRVEITDEAQGANVQWFLRGRDAAPVRVRATVLWRKGGYAVLGGTVEVR